MVLGIIRKATKVVDKLAHTLGSTRYLYIIRCNKGYTTNRINGMVKKKEKITFLKKNRHKIRIYSFILLYLQYQKIKENIYNRF